MVRYHAILLEGIHSPDGRHKWDGIGLGATAGIEWKDMWF